MFSWVTDNPEILILRDNVINSENVLVYGKSGFFFPFVLPRALLYIYLL